jgi:hypothetical protein
MTAGGEPQEATMRQVCLDAGKSARFQCLSAFNWPVRPSAILTRHDLSLPKTPTGAIVPSKPPGIGRMSVYGNTSMKSKNLKRVCYLLVAVASGAVPVAASADQKSSQIELLSESMNPVMNMPTFTAV